MRTQKNQPPTPGRDTPERDERIPIGPTDVITWH